MSRVRRRARYRRRVEAAALAAMQAGRVRNGMVYTVDVLHDPWCVGLEGKGYCNCNPAVGQIRELASGTLQEVPVAQLVHKAKLE
jgi:hypothetical protein